MQTTTGHVSLKKNVIANIGGSFWTTLMSIAFVPLYLKIMGPEAYGVVGVFTSLMIIFSVLDLGLSVALNREMARLRIDPKNANRMVSTIKTLEIIYWAVAIAITLVVVGFSHFLSTKWLNPHSLARDDVQNAICIMAFALGLRWPVTLYMGGLNGLQRQVAVNILSIATVTLQNVGALAVLKFIQPTVHAFFIWQAAVTLLQVIAFRITLMGPLRARGRFDLDVLKYIWRFAAGMSGITILAVVLTQLDKIVLSRVLSLKDFGYYTFAATVAAGIFKIVSPVFTAYYPKLVELVEQKDEHILAATYHQGCQLMSILLLPAALVLFFFAPEILNIWTGDSELVTQTCLLVSLLAIGNTLNGLMNMPYALQLAHGWTSLTFYVNLVSVIILAPTIYFAVLYKGAVGATVVWMALNSGYLLVTIQIMHRRLLRREIGSFYLTDILIPFLCCFLVCALGRALVPTSLPKYKAVFAVALVTIATYGAALAGAQSMREKVIQWWRPIRPLAKIENQAE